MNNLAVIIPFYKRHELTKLCFDRIKDQSNRLGFDVIVAGSEGDKSKELAKGLNYIETPNQPLGRKLNKLLEKCRGYDGVIILGSDDFMSDSIIKLYQQIDCTKEVYYSFDDVYVYSAKYKEVRSGFDYKARGRGGAGVGRLYTKPSLSKLDYLLWDSKREKGLDSSASKRCKQNGIDEIIIELGNHFLIDVKVEDNITSHEAIFMRDKVHDLSIMERLGDTGNKILKMKLGKERIYQGTPQEVKKIRCIVLKSFNNHIEKSIIFVKEAHFIKLSKAGYIKRI